MNKSWPPAVKAAKLEVPLRQVQVDHRVFQFDVPEQELDRPQVSTRLDEV